MTEKEDKKNLNEEDDGRVIADMSAVERPNLFSFRRIRDRIGFGALPAEQQRMSAEDRHLYILAAVRAGLLLVLAFAAGLAVVIGLFILFGRRA